jgi:hypothetical protein
MEERKGGREKDRKGGRGMEERMRGRGMEDRKGGRRMKERKGGREKDRKGDVKPENVLFSSSERPLRMNMVKLW